MCVKSLTEQDASKQSLPCCTTSACCIQYWCRGYELKFNSWVMSSISLWTRVDLLHASMTWCFFLSSVSVRTVDNIIWASKVPGRIVISDFAFPANNYSLMKRWHMCVHKVLSSLQARIEPLVDKTYKRGIEQASCTGSTKLSQGEAKSLSLSLSSLMIKRLSGLDWKNGSQMWRVKQNGYKSNAIWSTTRERTSETQACVLRQARIRALLGFWTWTFTLLLTCLFDFPSYADTKPKTAVKKNTLCCNVS